MAKRQKTGYPGVFFKEVRRTGGKTDEKERSYYIIFKKDGKNVEEHCGYQYRDNMTPAKAAKIRGQRIENRRQSRKQRRLESEWTFQKLWNKYVDHRKRENKGQGPTHSDVSRFTFYLKDTIGHITPGNLKSNELDPIHEKLADKAPGTRYAVLQLINRLSTYGKRQNLCVPIQFFIELPKVEIERTEQLTKKQLKSLLDVLHADGGQVSKLMELAVYTGMRRNEMFNLKWENVNFEHVFIRIMNNKSGKNPTIPMNQAARAVLKSMDETTEFVFQEIQGHSGSWILNRANMLKARAGLPDDFRPFHGMRHAFASLLVSEGVQLYQVSQLLTHRNLQMTQRYSHLSDESKQAATNVLDDILNGA